MAVSVDRVGTLLVDPIWGTKGGEKARNTL